MVLYLESVRSPDRRQMMFRVSHSPRSTVSSGHCPQDKELRIKSENTKTTRAKKLLFILNSFEMVIYLYFSDWSLNCRDQWTI